MAVRLARHAIPRALTHVSCTAQLRAICLSPEHLTGDTVLSGVHELVVNLFVALCPLQCGPFVFHPAGIHIIRLPNDASLDV